MNLLFVHLGTRIPRYLRINLNSTARRFPNHKIILITDQKFLFCKPSNFETFTLTRSLDFTKLDDLLMHPKNFRGNFWFSASARFLAIAQFASNVSGPFLHIESDVLLSKDFPLSKICGLETDFAFPVNSDQTGVASTVFIKNQSAAFFLAKFIIEQAQSNGHTNDMLMLRELYNKHREKVFLLPIGGISKSSYSQDIEQEVLFEIRHNLEKMGGVFDAWEFGPYLFGSDPRNRRGLSLVRSQNSPSFVKIRRCLVVYDKTRTFPSIPLGPQGQIIPLFSLHLHSKRTILFRKQFFKLKAKFAVRNYFLDARDVFYLFVFIKAVYFSLRRRLRGSRVEMH